MRGLASPSLEPFGRVYGTVLHRIGYQIPSSAPAQLGLRPQALSEAAELPRLLVRTDVDLPVFGCTSWQNVRWPIVLKGAEPLVGQHFSLAHEFKHAVDHRFQHELRLTGPACARRRK